MYVGVWMGGPHRLCCRLVNGDVNWLNDQPILICSLQLCFSISIPAYAYSVYGIVIKVILMMKWFRLIIGGSIHERTFIPKRMNEQPNKKEWNIFELQLKFRSCVALLLYTLPFPLPSLFHAASNRKPQITLDIPFFTPK